MIAGVLFLSWRIFELLVTVPIVGMLVRHSDSTV